MINFESHIEETVYRTESAESTFLDTHTAEIAVPQGTLTVAYRESEGVMGSIHWQFTTNTALISSGRFEVTSTMVLADELSTLLNASCERAA